MGIARRLHDPPSDGRSANCYLCFAARLDVFGGSAITNEWWQTGPIGKRCILLYDYTRQCVAGGFDPNHAGGIASTAGPCNRRAPALESQTDDEAWRHSATEFNQVQPAADAPRHGFVFTREHKKTRDGQEPTLNGRMQGRVDRSIRNELCRDAKIRGRSALGPVVGWGDLPCQPCTVPPCACTVCKMTTGSSD